MVLVGNFENKISKHPTYDEVVQDDQDWKDAGFMSEVDGIENSPDPSLIDNLNSVE